MRNLAILIAFVLVTGCKENSGISSISIIGRWQLLNSISKENNKEVYSYVGKTGDFLEITSNQLIIGFDGGNDGGTIQYSVIEKNKKLKLLGVTPEGEDQIWEIRDLTNNSMILYNEESKNGIVYVNYITLKR